MSDNSTRNGKDSQPADEHGRRFCALEDNSENLGISDKPTMSTSLTSSCPDSAPSQSLLPAEQDGCNCEGGKEVENENEADSAPDGGWGWVVCFGSFAINFMLDGTMLSFGVLLLELVSDLGEDKATVSWIGSLQMGIHMIMGPVISVLLQTYTIRQVVVLGSLIGACAFVVSVFAPNVFVLIFTYGVVVGIGFGFMYMPSLIVLIPYFNRRRAIATGIATSGSGLGVFAYAWITDLLLEHFNWRGTVLILGGLMLHCLIFGLLFRPLPAGKSKKLKVLKKSNKDKGQESLEKVRLISEENGRRDSMTLETEGNVYLTSSHTSVQAAEDLASHQHKLAKCDLPQTNQHGKLYSDSAGHEITAHDTATSDALTEIPTIVLSAPSLEILPALRIDSATSSNLTKTPEKLNDESDRDLSNSYDSCHAKPCLPSSSSTVSSVPKDNNVSSAHDDKDESLILEGSPSRASTSLIARQDGDSKTKTFPDVSNIEETTGGVPHRENLKQSTENQATNGVYNLQHPEDGHLDTLAQSRIYSHSADQLQNIRSGMGIYSNSCKDNSENSRCFNSHIHPQNHHALSPLTSSHKTATLSTSQTLSLSSIKSSSLHPHHRDKHHINHRGCYSLGGSRVHLSNGLSGHLQSKSTQHLAADLYLGSMASFGAALSHADDSTKIDDVVRMDETTKGYNSFYFYFNKFFPLRLLKDVQFLLMLLGFVMWTSLFITMTYLPAYAVSLGIERSRAAFLISIIGIANVLGRPLAGLITDYLSISSIWLYTCALALAALMNFVIPFCNSYHLLATCSACFGLCMAVAVSMRTIVLADQMGVDVLTESFGIVALFQGMAFIILPPVAGMMIEGFNSSRPSFWLVAGMYTVSATAMLSAACLSRRKARDASDRDE